MDKKQQAMQILGIGTTNFLMILEHFYNFKRSKQNDRK